jgi:hypothetical protein
MLSYKGKYIKSQEILEKENPDLLTKTSTQLRYLFRLLAWVMLGAPGEGNEGRDNDVLRNPTQTSPSLAQRCGLVFEINEHGFFRSNPTTILEEEGLLDGPGSDPADSVRYHDLDGHDVKFTRFLVEETRNMHLVGDALFEFFFRIETFDGRHQFTSSTSDHFFNRSDRFF